MKTDLKVGFQAAECNAMDTTHAGHATQIKETATYAMHVHTKNTTDAKNRIDCVHCFSCACIAYLGFFDCVASRVSFALHVFIVLHMATWKPHVTPM